MKKIRRLVGFPVCQASRRLGFQFLPVLAMHFLSGAASYPSWYFLCSAVSFPVKYHLTSCVMLHHSLTEPPYFLCHDAFSFLIPPAHGCNYGFKSGFTFNTLLILFSA